MLRTIAWYSNFATSLVFKIPQMYKVKRLEREGKTEEKEKYVDEVTSSWAMKQVKISGAKIKVFGSENIPKNIPVVFMSNHQGNFDIALFMSFINKPKGYVAKIEMKKIPLLRTWMEFIHCVFMDRSSLRKSAEAIVNGVKILKEGYSLVIFPEGTRSRGAKIGDFKAGSFKLATKAKVPIVPVTINGSYKIMEANNGRIHPADIEIYIHPIVETASLSKREQEDLPKKVKSIIESKLPLIK